MNMTRYAEIQEMIEAEGEPLICPLGNGYGIFLGTLGRLDWFRCAACGINFSKRREPDPCDPSDPDWDDRY